MGANAQAFAELGLVTKPFTDGINQAIGALNRLSEQAAARTRMMVQTLGALAGAGSVTAGVMKSINLAADWETMNVSFKVLLGNAQNARTVMESLRKFSDVTPYQMPEVAGAAKQMVAFGVAQKDIIPTMRMIGDLASGLNVPLGELTEIVGRAMVRGTLYTRQIMELQGRGIPIIHELAKQFGVADTEVMNLVSSGKVLSSNMMEALRNMTAKGGQFYGMMKQQSQTWAGLMTTVQDALEGVFRNFGTPIMEALKPLLPMMVDMFERLKVYALQWGTAVGHGITAAIQMVRDGTWVKFFQTAMNYISAVIQNKFSATFGIVENIFKNIVDVFQVVMGQIMQLLATPDFWKGMLSSFNAVALEMASILVTVLDGPIRAISAGLTWAFENAFKALGDLVNKKLTPLLAAASLLLPTGSADVIQKGLQSAFPEGQQVESYETIYKGTKANVAGYTSDDLQKQAGAQWGKAKGAGMDIANAGIFKFDDISKAALNGLSTSLKGIQNAPDRNKAQSYLNQLTAMYSAEEKKGEAANKPKKVKPLGNIYKSQLQAAYGKDLGSAVAEEIEAGGDGQNALTKGVQVKRKANPYIIANFKQMYGSKDLERRIAEYEEGRMVYGPKGAPKPPVDASGGGGGGDQGPTNHLEGVSLNRSQMDALYGGLHGGGVGGGTFFGGGGGGSFAGRGLDNTAGKTAIQQLSELGYTTGKHNVQSVVNGHIVSGQAAIRARDQMMKEDQKKNDPMNKIGAAVDKIATSFAEFNK